MCVDCCLCRTCCCGRDLSAGVFSWAVVDILFHMLLFPLPLLMSDIFFFSASCDIWIIAIIFADIVAILGEKSSRPGFLGFWLIISGLNIFALFLLWIAIGLVVYFMEFANKTLPFMAIKSLDEIWNSQSKLVLTSVCMFLIVLMPITNIYFWLVVRSLKRRLEMDAAIGYNENKIQVVSIEERDDRLRMNENRKEERRQNEMRMAMAILMANMKKGPSAGSQNLGQVSPHQPQPHQTSYF